MASSYPLFPQNEPIAVVGSACRFPGSASSPSKLWDLLREPRDVLRTFGPDRLNLHGFYHRNGETHGRTDVENVSYLLEEDVRHFDARFFRISPKEAHAIDPQQRLLLETVYESAEAAGWPLERMATTLTSVHVGSMTADYNDIQMRDTDSLPTYAATGLAKSILANRISYFFDLRGPSVTVDTACSSSLVALHQAVQGLRNGEADQAIVAGVNLLLDPSMYLSESTMHMLSRDSRCRMWDRAANGYGRGEGCASIVLKPLSRAIADGDHIECVVRETAVNSDGRTGGITMPSSEAQAALIRETYRRAGLDTVIDGCQYFECHGTGTQAGDPVEARAIANAFFPASTKQHTGQHSTPQRDAPLYCGSVKTVIGHLEGCAGLAGLLKASLALQNRTIPPNMHFSSLSPAVAPYYGHLEVPTEALPWPDTYGQPRRASVNSFGFGGTNAHVILESFDNEVPATQRHDTAPHQQKIDTSSATHRLFVFSANSPSSLRDTLVNFANYLTQNQDIDLDALSMALHSRRSALAFRLSITASSQAALLESLKEKVAKAANDQFSIRAIDVQEQNSRILGVFTGQGAQWPAMGRALIQHSPRFRASLAACEQALASLPVEPPAWSLADELTAGPETSRIGQARFSQPLCTAIQIALVDVLHEAGVQLESVVGHSSGEIGAAYAAGILSDVRSAMGIAYYRGLVADQACGTGGQRGGMLAAGLSYAAATEFCSQPAFQGRISVAASNSPSSVTLSGDADAIAEAQQVLDAQKKFARALRVDTAYHSHHMLRCEEAYLAYLEKLDIQVREPQPGCQWFSSVYPRATTTVAERLQYLRGQYWVDNMTRPVLFSQAVEWALEGASVANAAFVLALEIGPHPALKGPVNQTYKASSSVDKTGTGTIGLPYVGCLQRASDDVAALPTAFGQIWSYLGSSRANLGALHNLLSSTLSGPRVAILQGLPAYAWQHDQLFWHESRASRRHRLDEQAPHELLGRVRESCQQEMTWRNILRLEEIPWLRGHMFQGQVVFPGAAYVTMAVQASSIFAQTQQTQDNVEQPRKVRLVEINDMRILKAMVLEEDSAGVELLFTIKARASSDDDDGKDTMEAEFTAYSCSDQHNMNKCSEGRLVIHLENELPLSFLFSNETLLKGRFSDGDLPSLDVERFMTAVGNLGITYEGSFRTLQSIERARGHAIASASWGPGELGSDNILHPAVLDVAFQAGFATFLSTAEGAMGTTYLPAGVRSVVVDITQLEATVGNQPEQESTIRIESQLVGSGDTPIVEVDLDICGPQDTTMRSVQVAGLVLKAVGEPLPADDRQLFAKTVWDVDVAAIGDSGLPTPAYTLKAYDAHEYIDAVERTALFYLRTLPEQINDPAEIATFKPQHQALFRAIEAFVAPVRAGQHGILKPEWLNDTRNDIDAFARQYPESVDLALLAAVGNNLPAAVRGQTEILEHMLRDNLLTRIYTEGRGFATCNDYVADFMRHISYKHPRARILEVGAGTGGTTQSVLDAIDEAYVSYTYTDISAGFFEKATERFAKAQNKMEFKILNAEHAPADQGFEVGTYDIVVAANVLHATRSLVDTMKNVRSLLRPGGFLVAVEVTGSMMREPALMGGLEGWWLGIDDGRFPSPGISAQRWHRVLQHSGFSGVDTIAYDMPHNIARHSCSVFVTQAVDDRLDLLRDPLTMLDLVPPPTGPVIIIGGQTLPVSKCAQRIQRLLRRWTPQILTFVDLDELAASRDVDISNTQVLYLGELDVPTFSKHLPQKNLETLQELLASAQNVLWVTSGRRAENPHANMAVGIGRALAFELPHVRMQFLDFEKDTPLNADTMVQHLLRMVCLSLSGEDESQKPSILWPHEQEIVVSGDKTLVSRVVMDEAANEQYNAGRRRVERRARLEEAVEVDYATPRPHVILQEQKSADSTIDIILSTPLFLGDKDDGSLFLAHGKVRGEDDCFKFVLTAHDESVAHVDASLTERLPRSAPINPQELSTVASIFLALSALDPSLRPLQCGTQVIFNPPEVVGEIIQKRAKTCGYNVLIASTRPGSEKHQGWLAISPLDRPRTIRAKLPRNTTSLLFFSKHDSPPKSLLAALPTTCTAKLVKYSLVDHRVPDIALAAIDSMCGEIQPMPEVRRLDQLGQQKQGWPIPAISVLDWRHREALQVTVPPLNTAGFFRPDRTYLLVGMTGELGQSLCQFMINCGARHIVLASRNPPSGNCENWFHLDEQPGSDTEIDVKMVRMDVTSREQVQNVVALLRETMPPIAGVANAALVLEDALFVNTTAAAIEKQLGPKVNGTLYLDEVFSDSALDFFLCFSSLGSVFGNAGQSIYHAANMFTTSLVERRRRRGKAGSVIHVGMIVDAGYVARSTRSGANIEKHLMSQFYLPLAEREFHHLILQGVLAGRPADSASSLSTNGEVTMGIQPFIDDPNAPARPQWYDDARLSHMILPASSANAQGSALDSTSTKKALQAALEKATSPAEAADIYRQLFCLKLESMMKIPAESVDTASPLASLGLDSLLAVEIRTWLLKDWKLDVPLLRILSQDSVVSISAIAAGRLAGEGPQPPTSLTPETDSTAAPTPQHSPDMNGPATPTTSTGSGAASPPSLSTTPPGSAEQMDHDLAKRQIDKLSQVAPTPSPSVVSKTFPTPALIPDSKEKKPLARKSSGATSSVPERDEKIERMSFAQASMHFLHSFLDDPATFNVVGQYTVQGPLSVSRLQRALDKVMARHDAFRTRFDAEPGALETKQCISSEPINNGPPRLVYVPHASPARIQAAFDELTRRHWNLAQGRTFQCILLSHENSQQHTLIVGCHHIIMDGLSGHIFLSDLDRAYRLLPLDPVPATYVDFSRQQHEDLDSWVLDATQAYWRDQLDGLENGGAMPLLPLSHRRSRKARRVYENHSAQKQLEEITDLQMKQAAQRYGVTAMQLYLVALQLLLTQLLEHADDGSTSTPLCIGVTDSGRGTSGRFSDTVGHFTNLLPMNVNIDRNGSLANLVAATMRTVVEATEHADVPLDVMLERQHIQRSITHTPLFQVAFNYRVGNVRHRTLGGCQLDLVGYHDARTPYDITLNVSQSSTGAPLLELTSSAYLYTKAATVRLLDMYTDILNVLPSVDKLTLLRDLHLFSTPESAKSLGSRGAEVDFAWPEVMTERIEQVTAEFPAVTAIKDATTSLTYKELQDRVDDIANALLHTGVRPGTHVAAICHPSVDSHAAILALLSLKAVYIPLDVSLPAKRHLAMVGACKPAVLVYHSPTSASAKALLEELQITAVDLGDVQHLLGAKTLLPAGKEEAGNYSFILFTSGSTGTPKGIKLGQTGIMNYAASKSKLLGIAPGVRVLQQSSPGFDMSLAQAFNAFGNAGTLIIAPVQARGDPLAIAQLIARESIEFVLATPTEFLMLAQYAPDTLRQCTTTWKYACSGGEVVTEGMISELQRLDLPLLTLTDCYGPTEISCAATFRQIDLQAKTQAPYDGIVGESSSVGKPLPNTQIYILGPDGRALSSGHAGEIGICGRGVALGYVDTALNSGKFVPSPFSAENDSKHEGKSMYKTGDKGCLLPDGSLVFLGRMDDELVKLRGQRIELGEIERAILDAGHGALAEAVVTIRGQPEFLVAHVVFAKGNQTEAEQQSLLARLPSELPLPRYMVPSFFVPLDKLPTMPSGKADRRSIAILSLPEKTENDTDPQPLTVAQGELRLLWREVLGDVNIRADTDFFTVGGSSLLLVRLQNLLKERMGIDIPLHKLYQEPSLGRMAALASNERSLAQEDIDWEKETAIPPELLQTILHPEAFAVPPKPASSPDKLRVLLTGAANFLGSEILRVLATDPEVAEIHCIAIRAEDRSQVEEIGKGKATVYTGSLLSPTLGLTNAEQRRLQASTDVIVHAGASGHCLNNYLSVRQANFLSTQFLTGFALPYHIPLHFISSPRVILQSGRCDVPAGAKSLSMAAYPPGGDGSQGFTSSKWASERFLELIAAQNNEALPIVIHRACSLIGDRAPHDDAMNSVIRYSLLSGTVPHLPNAQGFFDFKDIVTVATDIAEAAKQSARPEGVPVSAGVVFQHHSSNVRVPFSELPQRLEALHGGKYSLVSMSEWLQKGLELGIEELIVSYLEANVAGAEVLMAPYLGE